MSWSISATGSKSQCVASVEAATYPNTPSVAEDVAQFEAAKQATLAELALHPDDAEYCSVSVSGNATPTSRSLSSSISGRVGKFD